MAMARAPSGENHSSPEVAIGAEGDAAQGEVVVKLAEARLEFGAFDTHAEIADADGEQFFVFERGPCGSGRQGRGRGSGTGRRRKGGGIRRDFHLSILTRRA